MTRPETTSRWRSPLILIAVALVLWLGAAGIDRRTVVVIENLGDHVRYAVAGTELLLRGTMASVEGVTVTATDSIDPPGGIEMEITQESRVDRPPLPHRFDVSTARHHPVGDWWVDGRSEDRVVFDRRLDLVGEFAMRIAFDGRFDNDLTVGLTGSDPLAFTLRRGLIDNYMSVTRNDGTLMEVTTLDPTPRADLFAIAAQLLRAAAAGCLLIAFVALVSTVVPGRREPSGEPPAEATRRNLPKRLALCAALTLALFGSAFSAWVAIDILGGLPHQIDEVVYLVQARWLLDGDVAPLATSFQHHLTVPFTYLRDGRWLGHYPVGWPLLLAVGLAVGAPHLITVVLGGIFVVLVFLIGRELDDDLTGLAAAALATVSPLARLLSGSLFPHAACAVLVALALWLALRQRRHGGWWHGAGIGLAMGCCLAVRPLTAVVVSLVLGGWLVIEALVGDRPRSSWITTASAVGAGLLASIPTLLHNQAVTGTPLSFPYSLAEGSMYVTANIAFGIRNLEAILASTSPGFFGWGWPLATSGLVAAVPLAFVAIPFLLRRARQEDWLMLAILIAVAVGHLPTRANGLHGFGARYVFDVAACLYLLTARGFRELALAARPSQPAVRFVGALFLILTLTTMATLPKRLDLFRGYYDITGKLERQLAATGLDEAVILVDGFGWWPWAEGARLMTGPQRHGILIAADLKDNSALESAFPDRPVLYWDGEGLHLEEAGVH